MTGISGEHCEGIYVKEPAVGLVRGVWVTGWAPALGSCGTKGGAVGGSVEVGDHSLSAAAG